MSERVYMFDSVFDARELIGQAVGAGSVCWENPEGAGMFDSTMAAEVADAAWNRLRVLLAEQFSEARVGALDQNPCSTLEHPEGEMR